VTRRYLAGTPTLAEFTDPRLVAVYDTVNAYGPDAQPRFYRELAAEVGAALVLDVGCGTGLISRDLAAAGHRVIGVEPAPAMLRLARAKPPVGRIEWVDGGVERLGSPDADLAIMSGHVAQFFLTEEDWSVALTALHRALVPGGRLAFESRDRRAREWERWNGGEPSTRVDPVAGQITTWSDGAEERDGIVTYTNHYRFDATGEELVAPCRLRFRTEAELTASLDAAGFSVERLHGDWDGRPAGPGERELIVVAVRSAHGRPAVVVTPGDHRGRRPAGPLDRTPRRAAELRQRARRRAAGPAGDRPRAGRRGCRDLDLRRDGQAGRRRARLRGSVRPRPAG
jgi:SAM-dependent methyltransferase